MFWYFMQTVLVPIFWEKKIENTINFSSAEFAHSTVSVKVITYNQDTAVFSSQNQRKERRRQRAQEMKKL